MVQPDPRTDATLVAAVLSGDTDAFAGLVRRYRDRYTRFAVRMLGSRADADDVLQGVFVRAFRNLESCDPDRFGSWLYRIVLNECRTFATRRTRRERYFASEDEGYDRAVAPATVEEELREDIQRALDQLAAEQREAFLLKHVEELSYEEMAEVTGVGVSALKMRVKRAGDRLRELLEEVPHE